MKKQKKARENEKRKLAEKTPITEKKIKLGKKEDE